MKAGGFFVLPKQVRHKGVFAKMTVAIEGVYGKGSRTEKRVEGLRQWDFSSRFQVFEVVHFHFLVRDCVEHFFHVERSLDPIDFVP